jgi:hypothetical protein
MAMVESAADSNRPAVILDIDGVLVLDKDEVQAEGYIQHPSTHWDFYNPAHGDWLRRTNLDTDIYYISDERSESHARIGQQLGVPEFDWINVYAYEPRSEKRIHARALAITALLGSRPVIWLDDEIGAAEFAWSRQRDQELAPTLLVKTDYTHGLEPSHMDLIDSWLQAVASR